MTLLPLVSLSSAGFAPFGDVVEAAGSEPLIVNQGFAKRYDNLAQIDVASLGGATKVSIFESRDVGRPLRLRVMERHPLGSQVFFPLQDTPWIVVVCSDPSRIDSYRAFRASGRQGVNYRRNAWHHPLLALKDDSRFLVVDRLGTEPNLEEVTIAEFGLTVADP